MNYYVLLTIPVPDTKFYIEIGLDYELPFHPNLTDEITIADYPCRIDEIYYDLDKLEYITIKATATDNLLSIHNNPPMETIHEWLSNEYKEIKEWCESNGERLILNDYYMHPERSYEVGLKLRKELSEDYCKHIDDAVAYFDPFKNFSRMDLIGFTVQDCIDFFKCEHESDGKMYGAMEWGASPQYKCIKCGETYK